MLVCSRIRLGNECQEVKNCETSEFYTYIVYFRCSILVDYAISPCFSVATPDSSLEGLVQIAERKDYSVTSGRI
jgi:hypothetical protein